jgi:hypothetical protein
LTKKKEERNNKIVFDYALHIRGNREIGCPIRKTGKSGE